MLTLAMFPHKTNGFTLIELLVTLVIIALSVSLVGPSIFNWLESRQAASLKSEVASAIAVLPLKANRSATAMIIDDKAQLQLSEEIQIAFTRPIRVLANGYCEGDKIQIMVNDRRFTYRVRPPLCELEAITET